MVANAKAEESENVKGFVEYCKLLCQKVNKSLIPLILFYNYDIINN